MKYSIIIFLAILLTGCGYEGENIEEFPNAILEYAELPHEVRNVYSNHVAPYHSGFLEKNGWVVNLDSLETEFNYMNTSVTGVRPGANIFTINGKNYYLKRDGNKEQPPFIFSNKRIYFLFARNFEEMNINDLTQLKQCVFKMYDLSD